MYKLPVFNTLTAPNFSMMQTKWSAVLNPVLSADIVNGLLIEGVKISTTPVNVNHMLQRDYKGWIITKKYNGFADINENQTNSPDIFIQLVGNGTCTVDLWVF